MRATTLKRNARLVSLKQAEAEYGLPYSQLLDLARRGELAAVQPPNVRRIPSIRRAMVISSLAAPSHVSLKCNPRPIWVYRISLNNL